MKKIIDWLSSLFHTDNNTAATIITSITVFLLGGLVKAFYQWLKSFHNKFYTRLVVLDTVKLLCNQLAKAKDAYEASHPKFELGDNMDFSYQDITIGQIQIFKDIGFTTIDKAFRYRYNQKWISRKRYELVDELWNIIISLNQYQGMQKEKISSFDTVFNTNNEKLQASTAAYLQYMYSILGQPNHPQSVVFQYTERLGSIHDAWQKSPNNSFPHNFEKLIIKPTAELNNEFMNQGINPLLFQSLALLSKVNFDLQNKRNILKSFKDNFKFGAEYFAEQKRKLYLIENELRPPMYFNLSPFFYGAIVVIFLPRLAHACHVCL